MAKRKRRPEEDPEFEINRQFMAAIPDLREQAVHSKKGFSYRGLNVRLALLALQPESGISKEIDGGNIKSKRTKDKICSEEVVLTDALNQGFTRAAGLVVVSNATEEQIEGILGFRYSTLLPCADCAGRTIPESPLVNPDTLVVTGRIGTPQWQVNTFEEIQDIYLHGFDPTRETPLRYGFANWDKRLRFYDELASAEIQKRPSAQASMASLAIRALNADVLQV